MGTKKFELIRPKSLDDSAYEDFEYLIRWKGRDGSDYMFMFYDAEIQNRIENTVINQEDEDYIQSLPESEERTIKLTANDLSLNDLQIVGQMFSNKFVTRVKTDGTTERMAPDKNRYRYRLKNGRYEVEIALVMSNLAVYK